MKNRAIVPSVIIVLILLLEIAGSGRSQRSVLRGTNFNRRRGARLFMFIPLIVWLFGCRASWLRGTGSLHLQRDALRFGM